MLYIHCLILFISSLYKEFYKVLLSLGYGWIYWDLERLGFSKSQWVARIWTWVSQTFLPPFLRLWPPQPLPYIALLLCCPQSNTSSPLLNGCCIPGIFYVFLILIGTLRTLVDSSRFIDERAETQDLNGLAKIPKLVTPDSLQCPTCFYINENVHYFF